MSLALSSLNVRFFSFTGLLRFSGTYSYKSRIWSRFYSLWSYFNYSLVNKEPRKLLVAIATLKKYSQASMKIKLLFYYFWVCADCIAKMIEVAEQDQQIGLVFSDRTLEDRYLV